MVCMMQELNCIFSPQKPKVKWKLVISLLTLNGDLCVVWVSQYLQPCGWSVTAFKLIVWKDASAAMWSFLIQMCYKESCKGLR